METVKEILSNPVVLTLLAQIAVLLIAKVDKTNTVAKIIKLLAEKLETK